MSRVEAEAPIEAVVEATPRPGGPSDRSPRPRSRARRIFRRGPWEAAATLLIGLGVVMLMQPLSMWLFSQSLGVILVGTIGFMIVCHFPD